MGTIRRPLPTVFIGTAALAGPSLAALAKSPDYDVRAVVTQPDRPKGRHLRPQAPPVRLLAAELGLSILQPERTREVAFLTALRELAPALVVVAAYGQILPRALLEIPPLGCLNVHASLLPRYRGAAPIQWAFLNGDTETGVTIIRIDEGLDTGDILSQHPTPITDSDDARTLHDRLASLGAALLLQTIPPYVQGALVPRPQPAAGASYARKITRADGQLDWSLPARQLWNRVRGLVPWPGTHTTRLIGGQPQMLKVWKAAVVDAAGGTPGEILNVSPEGILVACGQGCLRLNLVQLEGGRRLTAREFLAGHALSAGERLG